MLVGHELWLEAFRVSLDTSKIVTAGADKTVKIWESKTGKLLQSLQGHRSFIEDAVFNSDASFVATTGADRTKIWDVKTGKQIVDFPIGAHRLAFSPDGDRLATASNDGTIRIWDIHPESRNPEWVSRTVKEKGPWLLETDTLLPQSQPK